ncbi:NAD(P)H-hydrate dehydratase [Streptomyces sp. NBC_00237]|uniref:NAD(P)H-hydrate dehydratase n=1 Tax=Streptomyces sp. NBC_00237 TaxID=2975687 RepID=UPI00224ED1FE|nr:NAD(P)H-hydrate dehydratase [Streptomyces sp. NBC_00237]MCX5204795.1 NAD(P)H-hydrate dehydratase [Streptomyces sp. NBC_00237]
MRTAHRVETVRAAEREAMARLPEGALMQRAAAGLAAACADVLERRVYGARVVLLVGSGDNGGDTLYAGARLARRGAGVTAVLLAPERVHGGGLAALRAAGGRVLTGPHDGAQGAVEGDVVGRHGAHEVLARADLVLDGIVGIGGRGGLREEAVPLVRAARDSGAVVVAVDLPSGVDADTGEVAGECVRADVTVTFGTYKPGLLVDPARSRAGVVRLVDIGLDLAGVPADVEALQHADVAALLPVPDAESDKYRRGVVGVVAGSAKYPGAAVLCVGGALRGGAGAVRYVGRGGDAVLARHPEVLVHDRSPGGAGRVQSWVIGPGLDDGVTGALDEVLASDVPVLVDADALGALDPDAVRGRGAPTLLTPHAGEAARLLGVAREEVEAGRLDAARRLAALYGATVLLKGSTTVVAGPPGGDHRPVRVNPTGTPWLATAGSGDVLAGLVGSLLAAGLGVVDAASAGAYLHGLGARLVARGVPVAAGDVVEGVELAWRGITGPSGV